MPLVAVAILTLGRLLWLRWNEAGSCADSLLHRRSRDQREPVRDTIFSGREEMHGYDGPVHVTGDHMPVEPPDRRGDDLVNGAAEDELTFAVQDLGRERAPERPASDLGFVPARPAPSSSPPAAAPAAQAAAPAPPPGAHDGFVIREAAGAAPVAPVDALVVGAPEVVHAADPEAPVDAAPAAFRISSATAIQPAPADQLWTTRNPAGAGVTDTPPAPSRRGWSTRQSDVVDRSAHATMLRLREEAVNVSWKAAWIAVTSCDPRLSRKRGRQSSEGPSAL